MISIEQFVKERDEMLLKRSVPALRQFLEEHKECYPEGFIEGFRLVSDAVAEITLHKMIANVTTLPKKYRVLSRLWLIVRGYSDEL